MTHAEAATAWRRVADELRRAAAHAETAARHMDAREVPRACAHGTATRGHVLEALAEMDALARAHAQKAAP